MNERLELYKEILELEPNSKVFFAYAKLLVKEHRYDEAVQILAKGIEVQPDFLEARLYFIDLLVKHERMSEAQVHLHKLTEIFQSYSGFWYTWSKLTAGENITISSALGLLGTLFSNPSLSFMEILQAGIQAYSPENKASHLQSAKEISFASFIAPSVNSSVETNLGNDSKSGALKENEFEDTLDSISPIKSIQSILASTEKNEGAAHQSSQAELAKALQASSAQTANKLQLEKNLYHVDEENAPIKIQVENQDNEFYSHDATNVKISTNTKSMANLLAEQGDIEGAIEIFNNLLQEANKAGDKEVEAYYTSRISTLQKALEEANAPAKVNMSSAQDVLNLSPRLHSVLDRLADRLERRAQAS